MAVQNPKQYEGDIVIWDGTIIKTENLQDGTNLYILKMPLGYRDRPETEENSE